MSLVVSPVLVPVRGRRTPPGRLVILGLAGAAIGHGLTVAIAITHATGAGALLATSCHSYWTNVGETVVGAAAAVGVASLMAHALGVVRSGSSPVRSGSVRADAVALAVFQVVAFAATEAAERVAAHEPITAMFDHRLFPLGVVIQIALAIAIANLLRLSETAGTAIAGWRSPRPRTFAPPRTVTRRTRARASSTRLWSERPPSRAPPVLA